MSGTLYLCITKVQVSRDILPRMATTFSTVCSKSGNSRLSKQPPDLPHPQAPTLVPESTLGEHPDGACGWLIRCSHRVEVPW